jgi:hypothetical protein
MSSTPKSKPIILGNNESRGENSSSSENEHDSISSEDPDRPLYIDTEKETTPESNLEQSGMSDQHVEPRLRSMKKYIANKNSSVDCYTTPMPQIATDFDGQGSFYVRGKCSLIINVFLF